MDRSTEIRDSIVQIFLSKLSYESLCGFQIHRDFSSIFYESELQSCIQHLNPNLQKDDFQKVLDFLKGEQDNSSFSLINALKNGLDIKNDTLRLVDFEQVYENSFKLISHFTLGEKEQRPDFIVFLNGMPVAVIVFPWEDDHDVKWAYGELQRLKEDIPILFQNQLLVVLTGVDTTLFGLSHQNFTEFSIWNGTGGEHHKFYEVFFEKKKFLQFISTCIAYTDHKVLNFCRYPQHLIVKSVIQSCEKEQKAGLFFRPSNQNEEHLKFFLSGWCFRSDHILVVSPNAHIYSESWRNYKDFFAKEVNLVSEVVVLQAEIEVGQSPKILLITPQLASICGNNMSFKDNLIIFFDGVHHGESTELEVVDFVFYDTIANLKLSFPYATLVGYTGTPVLEQSEHPILGEYKNPLEEENRLSDMWLKEKVAPVVESSSSVTVVNPSTGGNAINTYHKTKKVMNKCRSLLLNNAFEDTFLSADLSKSSGSLELGAKFLFLLEEQQVNLPLEERSVYLFKECGAFLTVNIQNCSHHLRGQERMRAEYYKGVYECILDFEETEDIEFLLGEESFQEELRNLNLGQDSF